MQKHVARGNDKLVLRGTSKLFLDKSINNCLNFDILVKYKQEIGMKFIR